MEAASYFETVVVVLVSAYLSSCPQVTTTEYGTNMDRTRRSFSSFLNISVVCFILREFSVKEP
jgi:hypothetical protein